MRKKERNKIGWVQEKSKARILSGRNKLYRATRTAKTGRFYLKETKGGGAIDMLTPCLKTRRGKAPVRGSLEWGKGEGGKVN